MTGKKEKARFVFFKYVPPKKGEKTFRYEESQELGVAEELTETEIVPEPANFEVSTQPETAAEPEATEPDGPIEDEVMGKGDLEAGQEVKDSDTEVEGDRDVSLEADGVTEAEGFPGFPGFPDFPECPEPPGEPEEPIGPCPENAVMHVVRQGDTFWKLSQKYGTTVEAIADANPDVDPLNLQVGERICIPTGIPGAKG